MSTLDKAIELATKAHAGQEDKAGEPYVLHPLRVMSSMDSSTEKMVAILHDVLEDTPLTVDCLRKEGFSPEVIEGVKTLTKAEDTAYDEYLLKVKSNPLALKVKLADLSDNMNLARLPCLTPKDVERFGKYKRAWWLLTGLAPELPYSLNKEETE